VPPSPHRHKTPDFVMKMSTETHELLQDWLIIGIITIFKKIMNTSIPKIPEVSIITGTLMRVK
jgi:hypothetical protein